MCIIYLFSGIAKIGGLPWEMGEATWLSFDLAEYRSLDMTWMLSHQLLMNFMTHVTVFWELTYAALVWPALTRPWVLLTAIFVHGGIALLLGMPTFGLVMLIGNLAFVSPKTVANSSIRSCAVCRSPSLAKRLAPAPGTDEIGERSPGVPQRRR